ncbi:MAG: hypothetical protein ACI8P0_004852 [Planctomycetaceae bacterium]
MRHGFFLLLIFHAVAVASGQEPTPEQSRFFEEKVRPLLVEQCFRCHSETKQEGDLRLDARSAILAGGESGPAVVVGKPDDSLLIDAVRYRSLEMPPDRRLPKSEVDVLVKWVEMGAPWPGSGDEDVLIPRRPGLAITDADRNYWAFQPIRRPDVPDDSTTTWDDQPIDGFVFSRLAAKKLLPSRSASKRQLARRLYFDLIGLPPTYEEVEKFVADPSPQAFENLVNDLLNRPQYGERWGRHWLDVVRFAQTNGYERDHEKPHSWRYRDYVIRALNEDKPFDQFIKEQLAGDELDEVTHETIIATGYYRLGVWDDEPDDKIAAVHDGLADIVRTTGEAFLGLTIGCARCHDHKFDPIPQADYYSLLSFIRNVTPYGKDQSSTHWMLDPDAVFTPLVTADLAAQWKETRAKLQLQIDAKKKELESAADDKKEELKKQLAALEKQASTPPWDVALSVREIGSKPTETRIFIRGSHLTPGEAVEPAFLTVTGAPRPQLAAAPEESDSPLVTLLRAEGVQPTTRRRRVLADWIASAQNPLTARVIANRMWHHHFGRGIVPTPNDFGKTGRPPTHPQLLDWLASELIENGWSLKHLHRTILLSRTWQQSSIPEAEHQGVQVDPDNDLLWRQSLRRVEAEVIRDSMLAVSGRLNPEIGGRGFFPALSAEVLSTQSRAGAGWGTSDDRQRSRRSVYIFAKRTLGVPMMEAFDTPVPDRPEPARQTTTIAPQALILLNSKFVDEQAAAFAGRLIGPGEDSETASNAAICQRAIRLALARDATLGEVKVLSAFLDRSTAANRQSTDEGSSTTSETESRRAAVEQLARLVLNLNEFIYVD